MLVGARSVAGRWTGAGPTREEGLVMLYVSAQCLKKINCRLTQSRQACSVMLGDIYREFVEDRKFIARLTTRTKFLNRKRKIRLLALGLVKTGVELCPGAASGKPP